MSLSPTTLSKHLVQQQAVVSTVTHELSLLIGHIAVGGKIISRELSDAALGGELGLTGKTNVQGEAVQKLDKLANDVFVGPGTTIGRGTVVGARSNVFRSLPAMMVCYGTPAEAKKPRILS